MTEFAFAPGPGAPGTVGDLYRIFGTDRKRDDAPAVAPATKLVVRKHDFMLYHSLRRLSYPTAYGVARDPLDGSARVRAENFLHCDATDAR